jgi:hypothetical protein
MMLLTALALVSAAPMPSLAGTWQSVGLPRPITVEYRAISNDLATVERWRTASGRETMTVFVDVEGVTTATHYCAQGNVATLRGKTLNGMTTFDFVSADGVDPGEGVLVRLVLEQTARGLRRTETYREAGRDSVDVFEFVRLP